MAVGARAARSRRRGAADRGSGATGTSSPPPAPVPAGEATRPPVFPSNPPLRWMRPAVRCRPSLHHPRASVPPSPAVCGRRPRRHRCAPSRSAGGGLRTGDLSRGARPFPCRTLDLAVIFGLSVCFGSFLQLPCRARPEGAPMHDRSLSRRTLLSATAATAVAASAATVPAYAAGAVSHDHRDRLKRLISRMSIEEKVGQLFVMRVYGHSATAPDQADIDLNLKEMGVRTAAELIAKYHVGGIIYFAWAHNTRDPRQIAELSNGIQRAGLAQPTRPATADLHGPGARHRRPGGQARHPAARSDGAGSRRLAVGRPQRGADRRRRTGRDGHPPELRARRGRQRQPRQPRHRGSLLRLRPRRRRPDGRRPGQRLPRAPAWPRRRSTSPATATRPSTATPVCPVITHTREEWEELDAPPFRAAIAAGIDSIMTAHIVVPALDPSEDPATLSRPILTGILREELGYDGVVVTDALDMAGRAREVRGRTACRCSR